MLYPAELRAHSRKHLILSQILMLAPARTSHGVAVLPESVPAESPHAQVLRPPHLLCYGFGLAVLPAGVPMR